MTIRTDESEAVETAVNAVIDDIVRTEYASGSKIDLEQLISLDISGDPASAKRQHEVIMRWRIVSNRELMQLFLLIDKNLDLTDLGLWVVARLQASIR